MRLSKQQINEAVSVSVNGIPALAHVTHFKVVPPWKGSPRSCPSDLDYTGYTDFEYQIHDRKGYPAGWLERKLDREAEELIEEAILSEMPR